MKYMKTLGVLLAGGVLIGCSGQHRTDYYEAVALAAEAHSLQNIARTNALAHMASTGDSTTKAAAVMALALMKHETIRPAYIESEALSYTKALAAPIAGVAALVIQADLTNQTNKENNKTARAQISANSAEQTALFDALAEDGSGSNVTADLAINGLVEVATTGMTGMENISDTGIAATVSVSNTGMTGMENISDTGIAGVIDISKYGTDAIILLEETQIGTYTESSSFVVPPVPTPSVPTSSVPTP